MNTEALPLPAGWNLKALAIRAAIVLVLAGAAFLLTQENPETRTASQAGVVMTLPSHVGSFSGREQEVSEAERHILPKDTEFAKMLYSSLGGDQVNCQIVLSGGEKRSIHRPEICLPAQGWVKKNGQVVPVKLDNGKTLDVMKLVIARPVEVQPGVRRELTSLFIYWFVGKDITTPHHWLRILHSDFDRVVFGVSHRWAYVIVSAPVLAGFKPGGRDEKQTLEMLKSFIAEAAPQIIIPSAK